MIEPGSAPPEAPVPFETEPRRIGDDGCRKVALVGCGGLLVLLGVLALVLMNKAPEIFDRLMVEVEQQVEDRLPEDVTDEERQRLGRAFRDARSAVRRNEAEPAALRELQAELFEWTTAPPGETADRERVLELIAALEAVGRSVSDGEAADDSD